MNLKKVEEGLNKNTIKYQWIEKWKNNRLTGQSW